MILSALPFSEGMSAANKPALHRHGHSDEYFAQRAMFYNNKHNYKAFSEHPQWVASEDIKTSSIKVDETEACRTPVTPIKKTDLTIRKCINNLVMDVYPASKGNRNKILKWKKAGWGVDIVNRVVRKPGQELEFTLWTS